MGDHGRQADSQPVGDLLVDQSAGDERQHFGLALRERLRSLRLDGQGVFRSADAVLQSHERAHETLLVGLHVDAVHPGGRLSVGEEDGSVAAGAEEGVVRREELRRDEIMDEPLRIGLRKFLKVAENFLGSCQYLFTTDCNIYYNFMFSCCFYTYITFML